MNPIYFPDQQRAHAATAVHCAKAKSRHIRSTARDGATLLGFLFGVMASRKVARGTYASTSTFTEDAVRFAKENGIHLLDGKGLLDLIARRTPEQQEALLRHAYEGEYWRPTCASCGGKMVERSPRKGGAAFWGCAAYPKCRATLPMRSA